MSSPVLSSLRDPDTAIIRAFMERVQERLTPTLAGAVKNWPTASAEERLEVEAAFREACGIPERGRFFVSPDPSGVPMMGMEIDSDRYFDDEHVGEVQGVAIVVDFAWSRRAAGILRPSVDIAEEVHRELHPAEVLAPLLRSELGISEADAPRVAAVLQESGRYFAHTLASSLASEEGEGVKTLSSAAFVLRELDRLCAMHAAPKVLGEVRERYAALVREKISPRLCELLPVRGSTQTEEIAFAVAADNAAEIARRTADVAAGREVAAFISALAIDEFDSAVREADQPAATERVESIRQALWSWRRIGGSESQEINPGAAILAHGSGEPVKRRILELAAADAVDAVHRAAPRTLGEIEYRTMEVLYGEGVHGTAEQRDEVHRGIYSAAVTALLADDHRPLRPAEYFWCAEAVFDEARTCGVQLPGDWEKRFRMKLDNALESGLRRAIDKSDDRWQTAYARAQSLNAGGGELFTRDEALTWQDHPFRKLKALLVDLIGGVPVNSVADAFDYPARYESMLRNSV